VTVTVVDPAGVPAAPTNLQATAAKRKINLAWTQSSSPNITQNRIYRSTTANGTYVLVATIAAATRFSDRSVDPGTTYFYKVTAVNSSGAESPQSNAASATAR
jgi:fibronectin type 3 domain-containing protein